MDDRFSQIFIRDGLDHSEAKIRYKKRRQVLGRDLGIPYLITGLDIGINQHYSWSLAYSYIYQDPVFLYLTGLNQLHTALFVDPRHDLERLYLGPKDKSRAFWDGAHVGVGQEDAVLEAREVTGILDIRPISDLYQDLVAYMKQETAGKTLGVYWQQGPSGRYLRDNHYGVVQRLKRLFRRHHLPVSLRNIFGAQLKRRLVLDQADLTNMREALTISTDAFKAVCRHVREANSEQDLQAVLEAAIRKRSAFGLAFPSIVANGKNATVLHYQKNDAVLEKDALLLLDFGARWQQMNADVSRTIPLSGRFNPLQRLLYEIVLEAQTLAESQVKAGISIDTINMAVWPFIQAQLQRKFIDVGGRMHLPYTQTPHNIGHLIAGQVHDGDAARQYRHAPLSAGTVISNEPGLYGFFELEIDGKAYAEWIGIRIEDLLLITATGCQNLSAMCPKSVNEIETLLQT